MERTEKKRKMKVDLHIGDQMLKESLIKGTLSASQTPRVCGSNKNTSGCKSKVKVLWALSAAGDHQRYPSWTQEMDRKETSQPTVCSSAFLFFLYDFFMYMYVVYICTCLDTDVWRYLESSFRTQSSWVWLF